MHCAQNQLHRRRVSAHAVFVYAHSSVGEFPKNKNSLRITFSFSLKTMTHLRQVFVSTVPLAAMRIFVPDLNRQRRGNKKEKKKKI